LHYLVEYTTNLLYLHIQLSFCFCWTAWFHNVHDDVSNCCWVLTVSMIG